MASLRRIESACERYGLAVSRRPLGQWHFVVFRPLTSHDIAVIDIRDISDSEVEELATQWALDYLFSIPST